MKLSRLYTLGAIAVVLVILSLVFVIFGIATPSESFDEQTGLGKVFASSPEFDFDSGSLVMSCGKYSLSLNFDFEKPFLSLMSEGGVIHIHIILLLGILLAMIASCLVPEISLATSLVMAVFGGILSARMIPMLKQQIADGASAWDVSAGSFWFFAFIFSVLIINGLIGIGGKIMNVIVFSETAKVISTFIVAALFANAVSLLISLLLYLTVGLGFCAGVFIWFVVAVLFVIFCEIMDIVVL